MNNVCINCSWYLVVHCLMKTKQLCLSINKITLIFKIKVQLCCCGNNSVNIPQYCLELLKVSSGSLEVEHLKWYSNHPHVCSVVSFCLEVEDIFLHHFWPTSESNFLRTKLIWQSLSGPMKFTMINSQQTADSGR